jgi:hypothetical protein
LNLTATGAPLLITQFDVPFAGVAGSAVSVEIWTRPGTYVGFTGSNAGWTLTQTINGTAGGSTVWAPLVLTNPLFLADGALTGVYIHAISGSGLRYTGLSTAPPQTTWSNSDLTLFSDVARTGLVPFGGTQNSPRTFSGVVHYTVIPAPGVLALLGLAGVAASRRRRS